MSMFSTPFLSVTEEEGQPEQDPASCTDTMPVSGSKPLSSVEGWGKGGAGGERVIHHQPQPAPCAVSQHHT